MSNPRDDRYYGTMGKARRSPPLGDSQGNVFFQTGQVPLSYSTPYSQPRSSPGRYDYSPAVYNQWPANNQPLTQPNSLNYYDAEARYGVQNFSTSMPEGTGDRKLPPLSTSPQSYAREDRSWGNPQYQVTTSTVAGGNSHIRSPTASYPPAYASYTQPSIGANYTYNVPGSTHHLPAQTMTSHATLATSDPRPTSPYGRNPSHVPPTSYSPPPPVSPTSSEEPTIKKKRKRADAQQLKILTETYNRTAFPSTEERLELAKLLDMTPRSVQIWFQNRRQSMRQTRQSSTAGQPQSYTVSSDPMMDDMGSSTSNYEMTMSGTPYMPPTHTSPTLTSAHRRPRSQEAVAVDPHKQQQWSRAY